MDIRAFGKGYEQFYQNAKAMGIHFVKAKVARITQGENDNLLLRIEKQEDASEPEEVTHDMVVLSLGLKPDWNPNAINLEVKTDYDGFVQSPKAPLRPNITTMKGIFAAGAALGPKDIVDTIAEACAGAMEIENHLRRIQWSV
jgi:heterodisulfide reductase subunit A